MSEMLESSTILNSCDENSLIIVDELGRGTSTQDGYGLAYAIAKYLCLEKKAFTLFATHFHELSELEQELGQVVQNKHATAEATANSLTFLYQMKPGVADQSYGIHVAKVANFPEAAIQSAKMASEFLEQNLKLKVQQKEKAGGSSSSSSSSSGEEAVPMEVDQGASAEKKESRKSLSIMEEVKDPKYIALFEAFGVKSTREMYQLMLDDSSNLTKEDFVNKVLESQKAFAVDADGAAAGGDADGDVAMEE